MADWWVGCIPLIQPFGNGYRKRKEICELFRYCLVGGDVVFLMSSSYFGGPPYHIASIVYSPSIGDMLPLWLDEVVESRFFYSS